LNKIVKLLKFTYRFSAISFKPIPDPECFYFTWAVNIVFWDCSSIFFALWWSGTRRV